MLMCVPCWWEEDGQKTSKEVRSMQRGPVEERARLRRGRAGVGGGG